MKVRVYLVLVMLVAAVLVSCSNEPDISATLSPTAQQGREIANASGCASCHGKNGQGVTAPSWQGLYGEFVPLEGDRTVVADDEYLYRSITDPQAQIVRNWTLKMPSNKLTDDEVALVIEYIKELR